MSEGSYERALSEANRIQPIIKQYEQTHIRLHQQLKRFGEDLKMLTSTISNIQECFTNLTDLHSSLNPN